VNKRSDIVHEQIPVTATCGAVAGKLLNHINTHSSKNQRANQEKKDANRIRPGESLVAIPVAKPGQFVFQLVASRDSICIHVVHQRNNSEDIT
jgi:hypothetical protein